VHAVLNECGVRGEPRPQLHLTIGEGYDVGGPASHAGLTGRKTGIDTYGDMARQSGAALSGKDPSRIDRIGAYAARHAAKAIVAAGMAERCEVHLAYAIGQARPLSVSIQSFGTGRMTDEAIADRLAAVLDFRPAAIESRFSLRTRPDSAGDAGFYRRLAVYGHFGRTDLELPWEATGDSEALHQ
jgi:S-adenosylmethionine synthetase